LLAQVAEYSLVIFATALFAGASVATFNAFAGFERRADAGAAFSTVLTLASEAVENGSAHSTFYLPESTLTCSGGLIKFATFNDSFDQRLTVPCSFSVQVPEGTHTVSFGYGGSGLSIEVS
jgi:hypothetical protein